MSNNDINLSYTRQTDNGEQVPQPTYVVQMHTSNASNITPLMIPRQNAYYHELNGKVCCFCFDLRTGVIILGILIAIGDLYEIAYDQWFFFAAMTGSIICGLLGSYGAYKYSSILVTVLFVWLIIRIIFLVIGLIIVIVSSSIICDDGCDNDTDNNCKNSCKSVIGVFCFLTILVSLIYTYFTYRVYQFQSCLKKAEATGEPKPL